MRWPSPLRSLPLRRRLAGYALAAVLAPLLTVLLAILRGQLSLTTDVLAFLVAVMAVAVVGGFVPAVLEAIAGSLLLTFYFTPPVHKFTIAQANNAAALGVFVAAAVVVSFLADDAARHSRQAAEAAEAAQPIAEADRMRTALLAAVSHDLRTPLAAAKAAVSCLRSRDIQLTAQDHDDLLATTDESLDLLTHLVAGLLDVSRLQAGALPVFPRPADLGEIITRSLDDIGPQARAVMVDIPHGLPEAMVDPVIMERVIVNLAANALRYSPAGSPPLLTASARGDRVELRVVDRGPGVPEADRDQMFVPFQRLADAGSTTGVGLGLALARGLTEAMRGTLEPEETPGGGLTMTISVPAVPSTARADRLASRGAGEGSHRREHTHPRRRVLAWLIRPHTGARGSPAWIRLSGRKRGWCCGHCRSRSSRRSAFPGW
jgi:two-component system sensor histidine kinase KdpD